MSTQWNHIETKIMVDKPNLLRDDIVIIRGHDAVIKEVGIKNT